MYKQNPQSFYLKVYEAVKKIPVGRVATYGQIAALCGSPRASRAVGYALHLNPAPGIIPCHRVVNRFGLLAPKFAFGGADVQKMLLEKEGVEIEAVEDGGSFAVDLSRFRWDGRP